MAADVKQIELDFITTMMRSFDWTITSSSIKDDRVEINCERVFTGVPDEIKRAQFSRIQDILRTRNWNLVSTQFPPDKVVGKFEKIIKAVV